MASQNPIPDNSDEIESENWQRRVNAALEKQGAPIKYLEKPIFLLYRLTTRLLRITIGGIICIGVLQGLDKVEKILSKPFAALSPIELLSGLALALMCLVGGWLAFMIAFGQGETRNEYERRLIKKRQLDIENKIFIQDQNEARRNEGTQANFDAGYSVGRFVSHLLSIAQVRRNK